MSAYSYNVAQDDWQQVSATYSGPNGTYDVGGLAAGDYRIRFRDFDHGHVEQYWNDEATAEAADDIAVTGGATTSGKDAVLALGGNITGTITGAGGADLEDVEATAYAWNAAGQFWEDVAYALTNAAGEYNLSGLPTGTYRVGFYDYSHGYSQEYWNDKATLEAAADIPVAAGTTTNAKNAVLDAGAHITGAVTGAAGAPLAGTEVTAYTWNAAEHFWDDVAYAETNAWGQYDLAGLPTGIYRVGFYDYSDADHAPEYWNNSASIEGADDIPVTSGTTVNGKNARLGADGSIAGTVTAPPGYDLTDIYVDAYENVAGAWEHVAGTYVRVGGTYILGDLPAGTYRIGFKDDAAALATEYWDDKTTIGAANDITVAGGVVAGGRDATLAEAPARVTYQNQTLPTISGEAHDGHTLTANPGGWTPAGATYSYEWIADGSTVPGISGPTLSLSAGLVGKRISVRVTASGGGGTTAWRRPSRPCRSQRRPS